MEEGQDTPVLNRVIAWLRQPTTVGGIAGIAGILTAVSQGQLDWGQAIPLLVTAVILVIVPEAAGDVKIEQLVGGAIRADQVVVRKRIVAAEAEEPPEFAPEPQRRPVPAAAPPVPSPAPGMTPTERALAAQIEALTRAVALLGQQHDAKLTQPVPAPSPEVVRLQETFTPMTRPSLKLKPKPASAPLGSDPPGTEVFDELQVMARTIFGEARGEGVVGMEAVASVIMNRANNPRWWGNSPRSVCLKKKQFSVWLPSDSQYKRILNVTEAEPLFRTCLDVAARALAGEVEDRTGGADHYCNLSVANPSWARHQAPSAMIGNHTFFRLEIDPPEEAAPQRQTPGDVQFMGQDTFEPIPFPQSPEQL